MQESEIRCVCCAHTGGETEARISCMRARSTWLGLSHGPHRIRSAELEFEAILNLTLSPKVVTFAPDRGVAKLLPRLSVQPHLLPNASGE
jgi:hypothetical protein